MKRFLGLWGLLGLVMIVFPVFSFAQGESGGIEDANSSCEAGVELNTDIGKYIGGVAEDGCISSEDMRQGASLFGQTIAGLGKFVVQILVLVAFGLVIFGGVMIASSGAYEEGYTKGKAMIIKAIVGIILLGLMGTILYWLNPNFFKI